MNPSERNSKEDFRNKDTHELNEEQLDEVSGGGAWFGKYDGPPK